jgi:hypothetical protein
MLLLFSMPPDASFSAAAAAAAFVSATAATVQGKPWGKQQ